LALVDGQCVPKGVEEIRRSHRGETCFRASRTCPRHRGILGGGVSDNTPENLRLWLIDPQQVKPGVLMPNYHFTPEQLTQLMSYFQTLR